MTTFHYPRARSVVLGVCPNSDKETPVFGLTPSPSATKMDSLYPQWRYHAVGANAWWTKREFTEARMSHVGQILDETRCTIVIALGLEVQRELGLPPGPWYSWHVIERAGRVIHVMRFPHPSGLNRHWNEPNNRDVAASSLADAFSRR